MVSPEELGARAKTLDRIRKLWAVYESVPNTSEGRTAKGLAEARMAASGITLDDVKADFEPSWDQEDLDLEDVWGPDHVAAAEAYCSGDPTWTPDALAAEILDRLDAELYVQRAKLRGAYLGRVGWGALMGPSYPRSEEEAWEMGDEHFEAQLSAYLNGFDEKLLNILRGSVGADFRSMFNRPIKGLSLHARQGAALTGEGWSPHHQASWARSARAEGWRAAERICARLQFTGANAVVGLVPDRNVRRGKKMLALPVKDE